MAAIDVGPGASNLVSAISCYTIVDKANPANLDGTIDHLDVWINAYLSGTIDLAAFFVVSGNNLSTRGTATGLTPAAGDNDFDAPGDFTAFAIDAGDYLGIWVPYNIGLDMESPGAGFWYQPSSNGIPSTNRKFFTIAAVVAIYGTGVTAAVPGDDILIMGFGF